jgi:hypothetical protein
MVGVGGGGIGGQITKQTNFFLVALFRGYI